MPGGESDHMAVCSPSLTGEIVPVKDRIAGLNIPSRLTPEPVASRPATMLSNSPRWWSGEGGDIGSPFHRWVGCQAIAFFP